MFTARVTATYSLLPPSPSPSLPLPPRPSPTLPFSMSSQFYSYHPVSGESRRESISVNKALGRRYVLNVYDVMVMSYVVLLGIF